MDNININLGPILAMNGGEEESKGLIDNIFSYFLQRNEDTKDDKKVRLAFMTFFTIHFPISEFNKENKLFWHLCGYATTLGVNVNEKLIDIYTKTELKEFILKNRVHVQGTEKYRLDDVTQIGTIIRITSNLLYDEFERLKNIDNGSVENFVIDVKEWMKINKNKSLEKILTNSFKMMDEIVKGKVGTNDSLDYMLTAGNDLKIIYDEDILEDLQEPEDVLDEDIEFITDSGIPGIDNDTGGLYQTQMFGIEAGAGEGKSRFVRGTYCYRGATLYKRNVLDFMLEQSKSEVEAMYVARHIFELRNLVITDAMIITKKDKFGNPISEEVREIIEIARYDLFKSGQYGKIHIVADMLYLETFIERIKMLDMRHGPFDLILIDYMTLIEQENTSSYARLQEHQVYKFAYKWFKRYLRKTKKGGIAVNQLKGEEAKDVSSGKEASRNGGSGTLESRKTPDRVDVLSSSKAMQRKNMRRITPVKARSSEGTNDVLLNVKLGQCVFQQATNTEEYKE